ncbi:hypothetical protein V6667_05700 [Neisseria leonii]|uniref:hypothetical protein n=1 Tax=Neisseria leonii TaxID=2995413 RepID=UPI0030D61698
MNIKTRYSSCSETEEKPYNPFRHTPSAVYTAIPRGGMDRARDKAGVDKQAFRFRDLRAKAATDTDELQGVEAAGE